MVARLPRDPDAVATVWICLGSPCVGAFLPCYLEGTVPDVLTRGAETSDEGSPWWTMRALLSLVERDVARFAPLVRARWDVFEGGIAREAAGFEIGGTPSGAVLTEFMRRTVEKFLAEADALVREIGAAT
jgi:dipeptidase